MKIKTQHAAVPYILDGNNITTAGAGPVVLKSLTETTLHGMKAGRKDAEMHRYFVRLSSPFADAVWTVCRREAEVIDIRTGYPLVERHVVVYRATDAADAAREADRRNAPEQCRAPDQNQAEPRP